MAIRFSSSRTGARPVRVGSALALAVVSAISLAPPASAQMLPMMSRIAGPFAGRMGANRLEMAPMYGSQAGAMPHLLQGTEALMIPGDRSGLSLSGMQMSDNAGAESGSGKQDAPDADVSDKPWEVLIGACAGGAFIGGFSAISAAVPAGAAPVAVPAVASAVAIGCGLGIATATVSLGAVYLWRRTVQ
jgi:hypothetical protein